MDAREYLNRKGVGLDRDPDRPNTLEEKAWERARGSGSQRPKTGTPHDWEDWERYHDDLAEDADTLEQKIDKDAHQKARAKEQAFAQSAQADVEYFTPPAKPAAPIEPSTVPSQSVVGSDSLPSSAQQSGEPDSLKIAYKALAVLMPPLAIGLTEGGAKRVLLSVVLTLLGWLPGIVYAFMWLNRR